jgi:hypothetical protein
VEEYRWLVIERLGRVPFPDRIFGKHEPIWPHVPGDSVARRDAYLAVREADKPATWRGVRRVVETRGRIAKPVDEVFVTWSAA